MKFRYASYEVDPSPTLPSGVVHRPEVAIEVIGPRRTETIQALVDTGSDETVFPVSLARAIEVQLEGASAGLASAVSGHAIELLPGRIDLLISDGRQTYRWPTMVAFLDFEQSEDEVALLGYAGFLEFFRATFDSHERELELTPNERFPP